MKESNCSQQPDPNVKFSGDTASLMMISIFAERFIDLDPSSSGAVGALTTLVVPGYNYGPKDLTHVQLAVHGPQESPDSAGTSHTDSNQGGSYPTDSKERQQQQKKRDKEAGITREVRKIIKPVEDHHDDCGEDLTSINPDLDADLPHLVETSSDSSDDDIEYFHFYGPYTGEILYCLRQEDSFLQLSYTYFDDINHALAAFDASQHRTSRKKHRWGDADIAEICGGEARTTHLGLRRHMRCGPNFDIVTGFDLCNNSVAKQAFEFFVKYKVFVAVMAPECGPYGPMSNLNWHLYPETMRRKELAVRPLAHFCGKVAQLQLAKGLHFIQEQPHPSKLYGVLPWPTVIKDDRVGQVIYDRCAAGLKVPKGQHKGKFIKKPSSMTSSHPDLTYYFEGCQCHHRQCQHLSGDGHSIELKAAQVWTWKEASNIIRGVQRLKHTLSKCKQVYPVRTVDNIIRAVPGAPLVQVPPIVTCKACKAGWRNDHFEHMRNVGCRYPGVEPFIPSCQACLDGKPRFAEDSDGKPLHTNEPDCWWGDKPTRTPSQRLREPRTGKHPRDPARKASADPDGLARARGARKGKELGIEGEKPFDHGRDDLELQEGSQPLPMEKPRDDTSGPSSGSKEVAPKAKGNPLDEIKGPADPDDWSHFDVKRVLRTLRMCTLSQAKVTLRKLHIRWFHASAQTMENLLGRAGVPKEHLDLIPSICQTCPVCRDWAKPQPENVCSTDLPEFFNQSVECDLMFVHSNIIFHIIDRCTRWYESQLVPDRQEETIMNALDQLWCKRYGPPKVLHMDQEAAVQIGRAFTDYFHRKGIDYRPRAKGQQVPYIDRRGALVREVINKIISQLKVEKIRMPMDQILAEAQFVTNALLTVNGSTPYNALYGRVPLILPDLNQVDAPNEESLDHPGLIRHTFRLREIAVGAMIAETALHRAQRALNTRTIPAGEREKYQPGDLVDFYRPPGSKDVSGWTGPAKVIDPFHLQDGTITIKHVHRPIEVRIGDLRRHMSCLVYWQLAHPASAVSNTVHSWTDVRMYIESHVPNGKGVLLGVHQSRDQWVMTSQTPQHQKFYHSVKVFLGKVLRRMDIVAIRVGKGCAKTPPLTCYEGAITMYWYLGTAHTQNIWSDMDANASSSSPEPGRVDWVELDPDNWTKIRFVQALFNYSVITASDDGPVITERAPSSPNLAEDIPNPGDPLPSISEEDSVDSYFKMDGELDEDMMKALKEANHYASIMSDDLSTTYTSDSEPESDSFSYFSDEPPGSMQVALNAPDDYHVMSANVSVFLHAHSELDRQEDVFEIYYEHGMHKIMRLDPADRVSPTMEEPMVCEQVFKASKHKNKAFKKAVVERKDHNLSPSEINSNWTEVAAAMQKELKTWVEMGCICRKPRDQARNVIDCRWVLKWKEDAEVKDASDSMKATVKRWVIRARLCLRGFKDLDAKGLESYAGTASRFTQRILVSEAVVRKWDLCTTDISKAFLQGVTYEELAEATGEPLREVNFYLPSYCYEFLRKLPGWEDFDPKTEVIHCVKPGTGCNDAPRCFSLKLSKVTRDLCKMQPCTTDGEICLLHTDYQGKKVLKAMMCKHVDDLKLAGERETIIQILKQIETVFGQLKIDWNSFTNCGVRHTQDPQTKEVKLDQDEYIKGIKTCISSEITRGASEVKAGPELHAQYWSVLGAIAYAVLTRPDIAVFVSALQRWSHAPAIIHCKRLNAVVRWTQRNPRGICYRSLDGGSSRPTGSTVPTHLRQISDAAFKKEDTSGHSMRGACWVRCVGNTLEDMQKSSPGHLLEFVARSQRRVTRSTFTSELQGGCDSVDKGFLLLQTLDEMQTGRISAADALARREHGGWAVPAALYLDALSVFASITATFIKTPADNGVLVHCLYLRELLDNDVLFALIWLDTRDMTSDGFTKGAVDRKALHDLMDGQINFQHACKAFRAKHLIKQTPGK